MKHDIELYKCYLLEIFRGRTATATGYKPEFTGDELLHKLVEVSEFGYCEARKILTYCRTKGIVTARHYNSNTFKYSLNFNKL